MKRIVVITLSMLLLSLGVTAQQSDDYRYYKLFEDSQTTIEIVDEPENKDSLQIQQPQLLWHTALFDSSSAVINDRHGMNYYDKKVTLNGITIPQIGNSRARRLSIVNKQGLSPDRLSYSFTPITREQSWVGIDLATRNYTLGINANSSHHITERFTLCSDVNIRTGGDLHVDGVFSSEAALSLTAQYRPDSLSSLDLLVHFAPSERSARRAAVAETFALTGNNYYNPGWGYQAGKVRSANITRTLRPIFVSSYSRQLSDKNTLIISLGGTITDVARNGIEWLGAATPLPDNYRKLPSYFYDSDTSTAVAAAWSSCDSRYTQINFDELFRRNALQTESIYLMADKVSRLSSIELCAAFNSQIKSNVSTHYGLRASYKFTRNFKQATDLLGGKEFTDIDYYLVDDDTFSNMLQNDMQHPNRKIGVGDRYGYHYSISDLTTSLFAAINGTFEQISLRATAEVGSQTISRRGYFRKELFADNSFGRSRSLRFAPWALNIEAEYAISHNHNLYAALSAGNEAAEGENILLQSQYNNRIVENPTLATTLSALLGYKLSLHKFALNTTLFARQCRNMREVTHIYYDVADEFADIVTSGISTIAAGIESQAHYSFTKHWRAAVGVSAGIYNYTSAPNIKVYADDDNALIADSSATSLVGLNTGRTPQITLIGRLNYNSRGWRAALDGEYYALRYVAPSPIRRSDDVLAHAATEQIREELITQERLPDAFVLNLTLSKNFYLRRFDKQIYTTAAAPRFIDRHPRSRISILLAVNNLLGNSNIIYRGYESSRIRKRYLWEDIKAYPMPSYYLYAYPRTFYMQIKFTF